MNDKLRTIITDAKARVEARNANGREKINVCIDSSSIARGAEETLEKIHELVEDVKKQYQKFAPLPNVKVRGRQR